MSTSDTTGRGAGARHPRPRAFLRQTVSLSTRQRFPSTHGPTSGLPTEMIVCCEQLPGRVPGGAVRRRTVTIDPTPGGWGGDGHRIQEVIPFAEEIVPGQDPGPGCAARSGTRSRSASPWPPPHSAAAPMPPPRRASANARCRVIRVPDIPSGWPSAIAPPVTLTLAGPGPAHGR